MHFFCEYYSNIVKYDLINKFWYLGLKRVPKFSKVILELSFQKSNSKELSVGLLALELISSKKGQFVISKKSSIFLKIRKGHPIGCKLVLQKKLMYHFLSKLVFEVFPKFKMSLRLEKEREKLNNKISYTIKNGLLFLELEQNYDLFNTDVKELSLTFVTNEITQKELYYLIYSFKQPLEKGLSK